MLAGRGAGCLFLGVKGVDDVLAGVKQGLDVFLVSRASMTCLLVWNRVLMAVFMAMGRLMGFFRGFPRFSRSSGLSRS